MTKLTATETAMRTARPTPNQFFGLRPVTNTSRRSPRCNMRHLAWATDLHGSVSRLTPSSLVVGAAVLLDDDRRFVHGKERLLVETIVPETTGEGSLAAVIAVTRPRPDVPRPASPPPPARGASPPRRRDPTARAPRWCGPPADRPVRLVARASCPAAGGG